MYTIKKAHEIIHNNFDVKENTIIHSIAEKNEFKDQLFWECYNAVRAIAIDSKDNLILDKELAGEIHWILVTFLSSLIDWGNPKTGINIKNMPNDLSHVNRLKILIDGYFRGYVIDEQMLTVDDNLTNPML